MSETATVLIVGRDQTACARLAETIHADTGLHGAVVTTIAAARSMLKMGKPGVAAAIVDVSLPNGEGHTLCADMAQAHKNLPVMMISDGYSEADALQSLRAGAIDYFHRPHHREELLARLRAHLRSKSTSLDVHLKIGPFSFHPGQRILLDERRQSRIWLTAKEARILRYLHMANGRAVPKAELLGVAWGSPDTSVHTLQTHIYRLRTKLKTGGAGRPLLVTTAGGYVLDM